MNARRIRIFRSAALLAIATVCSAAEPCDPYEVAEDRENVLASSSTAPTLTLGTLPEFRLTLDASMPGTDTAAPTSPGSVLGGFERRVKGVEFLVPQTRTLWFGWEQPDAEGDSPRATFSIRNSF